MKVLQKDNEPIYLNENYSYEERAIDLVSLMTLEEKIYQLIDKAAAILRLGVKEYDWWNEGLHGVARSGKATSFPTSLSMGCTWNVDLVQETANITSDEGRAYHNEKGKNLTYWSPTINLARDLRWGRNDETYGEDPFLTAEMGKAFVNGLQGKDSGFFKLVATIKHFAANNSEFNRHTGSSDMDEKDLREYYLAHFQNIIENTDVGGIMSSYNRLNKVPTSSNKTLLTDILRKTWGYKSAVTADCGAVNDIYASHRWIPEWQSKPVTPEETAAYTLKAGCDLDCGTFLRDFTKKAVEEGILEESEIDNALIRLFTVRMKTGEFNKSNPYENLKWDIVECDKHIETSLKAARESLVLLQNKILPVNSSTLKKVLVVGSLADYVELGGYSGSPEITVKPLEGIKNLIKEVNPNAEIIYDKGVPYNGGHSAFICNFKGFYVINSDDSEIFYSADKVKFGNGCQLINNEFLGYVREGAVAKFSDVDLSKAKSIKVLSSSCGAAGEAVVEFRYNALDGALVSTVEMHDTKDWDIYDTFESSYSQGGFNSENADLFIIIKHPVNTGEEDIERVKALAKDADLVIVCTGTYISDADEEKDRSNLELPRNEAKLISEITSVNKNVVVSIQAIGPCDVESFKEKVGAILFSSYNGQMQGKALADIIFGKCNPSGKIPFTWYKSVNDLGDLANYSLRGINDLPKTYWYTKAETSYPFGHGLSYTTFKYSDLITNGKTYNSNDTVKLSVNIKNTGNMDGYEVAEVYVKSPIKNDRPIKQLKAFKKIFIKSGETQKAEFEIKVSDIWFWDMTTHKRILDNGEYVLFVGPSSDENKLIKTTITVKGEYPNKVKNLYAVPSKKILNKGETAILDIALSLQNDLLIEKDKLNYKVNSLNNKTIEVVGDKIFAKSSGRAKIKVTVLYDNQTLEKDINLLVR